MYINYSSHNKYELITIYILSKHKEDLVDLVILFICL